jgi:hypothetical protein
MNFLSKELQKLTSAVMVGLPAADDPSESLATNIEVDGFEPQLYRVSRDVVTSLFGPSVAAMIFYQIGLRMAEILITYSKNNAVDSKSVIEDFFFKSGVGKLRIEESSAEAYMQREFGLNVTGQGRGIGCYLARGTFQRYYESLFGDKVALIESFCGTKENMPCRFTRHVNGV